MQFELINSEFIVEFASGGRKNYAYRLITNEGEKTVCKVRSITQNYHALKLVNFKVVKAMILGQGESVVTYTRSISSNARGELPGRSI